MEETRFSTNFEVSVPLVFDVEGGYSNNPDDDGGPTMHGVAWNYNADYLKKQFGLTRETIQNLTKDQAKKLYWDKYWKAAGCHMISDEGLSYLHFDAAVNTGVGHAITNLHKLSVNPFNYDGEGDKNEVLFLRLCIEYLVFQLYWYTHCKDRKVFLEGWINRMIKVIGYARKLV